MLSASDPKDGVWSVTFEYEVDDVQQSEYAGIAYRTPTGLR